MSIIIYIPCVSFSALLLSDLDVQPLVSSPVPVALSAGSVALAIIGE